MEPTLPYTALVTVEQVRASGLGGVTFDTNNLEESAYLISLIGAVSGTVEAYLRRRLIVKLALQYFAKGAWSLDHTYPNEGGDPRYAAFLSDYPIVQVLEVDGDEAMAGEIAYFEASHSDMGRVLVDPAGELTALPSFISTYVGYARADQDLDTLNAIEGLEDLTVLPPTLPDEITNVVVDLVLHRFKYQKSGLAGMRRVGFQVGSSPITMEAPDRDYEKNTLLRIHHHKKF